MQQQNALAICLVISTIEKCRLKRKHYGRDERRADTRVR
jgi:hypothetical protein